MPLKAAVASGTVHAVPLVAAVLSTSVRQRI
jgi:hypothetical protein